MQDKLRDSLHEPICSSAVALTTVMWTDNFRKLSYLDVHAFWVSNEFALKHCLLAVEHFGPTPTRATIFRDILNKLQRSMVW